MNCLGNLLWIIFGGLAVAVEYFIAGISLCLTIIGIPFGVQMFKLGLLSLVPFGQRAVTRPNGTGCIYSIFNILWMFTGGLVIALTHLFFGLVLCVTIIGIPFGLQHFKLMQLAFWPFGKDV
ncbi:MAG: YccF domain-containing protein [Paludibacteraceae bacterium]|nr:YccF domain-containing protein [Paludibacteraceae bacterium]